MLEPEFLDVVAEGHIATVTMNRPSVNSVNQEMYREIRTVFSRIHEFAPDARAVIFTGSGKHFCGGNDLEEFQTMDPQNVHHRMMSVREAFNAVYDCVVPVIAAVKGVAVGTGVALAGSADLVVAAQGAKLSLPEIQVGAMGGAKHLSRLVPQQVVRRMHFTADMVQVEEIERYGGITSIVPGEDLEKEARELANRIIRHSPVAIQIAKRSLNQIEYMDLKSGYQFEQSMTGELSGYEDAKEAVTAFFERREPRYTGQ